MMVQSLQHILIRDLKSLQKEIEAYDPESKLWEVKGQIKNSAGNLTLHLCGNLQHFIGNIIGETGYQRDRPAEFALKDVPRSILIKGIKDTQEMLKSTLEKLHEADLQRPYPKPFFPHSPETVGFYLTHLATHLNYHLGQVNYHRRLV